jgi:hypothetical protein
MTLLTQIQLKLLFPIKSILNVTHDATERYIFKLHESLLPKNKTEEDVDTLAENLESFLEAPNRLTETLTDGHKKYKDTVHLYFILKQISAMYEAESKRLPIQVFNEMRNALDHFIRSLILPDDPEREIDNILQMNRHIQRAFLDTSKILCAFYDESSKEKHNRFSDETIGYVEHGDYQKEFTRLQVLAHEKYIDAKLLDYKLGNDGDLPVRDAYINSVIAHKELSQYQTDNYHKIKWASAKLTITKGLKWTATIIASIIAGIIMKGLDKVPDSLLKILNF